MVPLPPYRGSKGYTPFDPDAARSIADRLKEETLGIEILTMEELGSGCTHRPRPPEGFFAMRTQYRRIFVPMVGGTAIPAGAALQEMLDNERFQTWEWYKGDGARPHPFTEEQMQLARIFVMNLFYSGYFDVGGAVGLKLWEVDRKNWMEYSKGVCASHDYCDANVFMDRAFRALKGYRLRTDSKSDEDFELWSKAFGYAKTYGFRRIAALFEGA